MFTVGVADLSLIIQDLFYLKHKFIYSRDSGGCDFDTFLFAVQPSLIVSVFDPENLESVGVYSHH